MTHNDFNEIEVHFCYNLVASKISDTAKQLSSIDTSIILDRKLSKKLEKLNKMMQEAKELSNDIYEQVCRY